MPRACSSAETDEEFIERCPSSSFATPEANKSVPIRPFKRCRNEDGEEQTEERSRSPSPVRGELSPRRLDLDQVRKLFFLAPTFLS